MRRSGASLSHGYGHAGGVLRDLLLLSMILAGCAAQAGSGAWSVRIDPMYMQVYGHDQHVLTVHEIDRSTTPEVDRKTAVDAEVESGPGFSGQLGYSRGPWGVCIDFRWFINSVVSPERTAAGGGSPEEIVFEVADRQYSSTDPDTRLYFGILDDTDLACWTVDLYVRRRLAGGPEGGIDLLGGIRNGDFDNDYHAVVGIQDMGGTRIDASSNYGRMIGPMVGLSGVVHLGRRNTFRGNLSQSVIVGDAELTTMAREYEGPFRGLETTFTTREELKAEREVAIPISECRLDWTCRVMDYVSLGLGVHTSAWWDVAVPPGVVPGTDQDEALQENTLVFVGALASLKLTF